MKATEVTAWVLVGVCAVSFAGLLLLYILTLCMYRRKLTLTKSSKQSPKYYSGYEMDGNVCYQPGLKVCKDEVLYDCIKE